MQEVESHDIIDINEGEDYKLAKLIEGVNIWKR